MEDFKGKRFCRNCSLIMTGEKIELAGRSVHGPCERCGETDRLTEFKDPSEAPRVTYVPEFAKGDPSHPACERGWLKRWSEDGSLAFVHFTRQIDGKINETAQGCAKRNLLIPG